MLATRARRRRFVGMQVRSGHRERFTAWRRRGAAAPSIVSAGIAEAMITTASPHRRDSRGVVYNYFTTKTIPSSKGQQLQGVLDYSQERRLRVRRSRFTRISSAEARSRGPTVIAPGRRHATQRHAAIDVIWCFHHLMIVNRYSAVSRRPAAQREPETVRGGGRDQHGNRPGGNTTAIPERVRSIARSDLRRLQGLYAPEARSHPFLKADKGARVCPLQRATRCARGGFAGRAIRSRNR